MEEVGRGRGGGSRTQHGRNSGGGNPGKSNEPTKKKEINLVKNMVTSVYGLEEDAKKLSEELENGTSLEVADSQVVAIAIANDLTSWSGNRYVLRDKTIGEIEKILEDRG